MAEAMTKSNNSDLLKIGHQFLPLGLRYRARLFVLLAGLEDMAPPAQSLQVGQVPRLAAFGYWPYVIYL